MQQANRIFSALYYTAICDLSSFTVFSILSLQQNDVRNCVIEQKMCWDLGYNFVWSVSHYKKIQRKTLMNVYRSPCQVNISPFRFERNLKFLDRF